MVESNLIDTLLSGFTTMMLIAVVVCIIVIVAIGIDLACGWHKAKLRGEGRRSEALRRTVSKFVLYEGAVLMALCIDLLLHLCRMYRVIGVDDLFGIPFISCLAGIVICGIEIKSIREKADEKTRKNADEAINILAQAISRVDLISMAKNKTNNNNIENEEY